MAVGPTTTGAALVAPSPRAARAALADEIERLMAQLDALDGDPDLEDGDDDEDGADGEPSLGWTDAEARWNRYGHRVDPTGATYALDAEHDDCDREAGMNELWPTQSQDIPASIRGLRAGDDDEDGHDAEADRSDDEAPLGWAESESLTGDLRAGSPFGEDEGTPDDL